MSQLKSIIERAWEDRTTLSTTLCPPEIGDAVKQVIEDLDKGKIRATQ